MVAMAITVDELLAAWPRVRSGGGSAGCDGVSVADAERDLQSLARGIADALAAGTWSPAPLRRVLVEKPSGGVRELSVPTVADRLLSAALLARLEPLLSSRLHPAAHAYVPGRGAHSALAQIEAWRQGGDSVAFTTDINDFFPSIDVARLFAMLAAWLPDRLELLAIARMLVEAPSHDGTPTRGLPQGLSLSPLFSNLYMAEVDRAQCALGHYLRYSDNILLMGKDSDGLERRGEILRTALVAIGLHLKPTGTVCAPLSAGIPFLGFTLTDRGARPGADSLDHLHAIVAEADAHAHAAGQCLDRRTLNEHVRRWASYFRPPPLPALAAPGSDDPQLHAEAEALLGEARLLWDNGHIERLAALRARVAPLHVLRHPLFHRVWGAYCIAAGEHGEAELALRRHLMLQPGDACAHWLLAVLFLRERRMQEALAEADACVEADPGFAEGYRLLASCYRMLGAETLAVAAERDAATVPRDTSCGAMDLIRIVEHRPRTISTSPERDAVLRLLGGHDEMHAIGSADSAGRAIYRHCAGRIDHDLFRDHLAGKTVVAAYLVRADGMSRVAAFDIDIARKVLQRHRYDEERLAEFRRRAQDAVRQLLNAAHGLGLEAVPEDSGGRGYHLWFIFHDPVPASRARQVLLAVRDRAGQLPEGINLEIFPANDKPDPQLPGNRLRLPCGVHPVTRAPSRILDRHLHPVAHPMQAILGARRIAACDIERVLCGEVRPPPGAVAAADPVGTLLRSCAVLHALADKAATLRHLAHHERWVLGSCLKPLGEAGRAAVHHIISACQNYDYHQTESHLRRIKDQPIGCHRIQQMLPGLATSEVCRCRFPQRPGRYFSPTCHVGIHPIHPKRLHAQKMPSAPLPPPASPAVSQPPAPPSNRPSSRPTWPVQIASAAEFLAQARRVAQSAASVSTPPATADTASVGLKPHADPPPDDSHCNAACQTAPAVPAAQAVPPPLATPPASPAAVGGAASSPTLPSGPTLSSAPAAPPLSAATSVPDDDAVLADLLACHERLRLQRQLLVERIRAAGGSLRTIRGICRLMDGIPCLEL
ncbi:MAG: reverse transcriptase domain-containing protein [Planctomycetota bacterium]|nr:reverse transcriptase domain-containing protein [Planctomycetota bacterium]MCX8039214.1 reverse transcriptase domain-containing protein [Planctomycetota bacterium]